jgi:peptidoglycan/xylan/chitin deacetylase (PgdA/CDA1 family)
VAGVFTISLDFELHWGGFEKWPLSSRQGAIGNGQMQDAYLNNSYEQYFHHTRQVIPKMLALFERYGVHVTWASVGMLFHENRQSLESVMPVLKPTYQISELSAYQYMQTKGIGEDERDDPFHYAAGLIKQIVNTPHQELASHTFAHYYCNEAGQTLDQFRADLQAAQQSAALLGKRLQSLVFPRNQFNDAYLKVCFEEGFTSVRSNPRDWFWHIESTQSEGIWKRLNRGLDAYFPIGNKNTYTLDAIPVRSGYPLCIPASRLLRPYRPKDLFLNHLKISRIRHEMQRAAKAGEVYHLWWHPHNFGWYPHESLHALEEILSEFRSCHQQWQMSSLSMGEITDHILQN